MSSFKAAEYYQSQLQHYKQILNDAKSNTAQKQYYKVAEKIDAIVKILVEQIKNGVVKPAHTFDLTNFDSVEKSLVMAFLRDLHLNYEELKDNQYRVVIK